MPGRMQQLLYKNGFARSLRLYNHYTLKPLHLKSRPLAGHAFSTYLAARNEIYPIQYPKGALRLNRIKGREYQANTAVLEEFINRESLQEACLSECFLENPYALRALIDRDASQSPAPKIRFGRRHFWPLHHPLIRSQLPGEISGIVAGPYTKVEHASITRRAVKGLQPTGSCKDQFMLLVYPTFLRLVVVSREIRSMHYDSHFFCQDFPRLSSRNSKLSHAEETILNQAVALDWPEHFIEAIRGAYDWSAVRVSFVVSRPALLDSGTATKIPPGDDNGMLGLHKAVNQIDFGLKSQEIKHRLCIEAVSESLEKTGGVMHLVEGGWPWLWRFLPRCQGLDLLRNRQIDGRVVRIVYTTQEERYVSREDAENAGWDVPDATRRWRGIPDLVKQYPLRSHRCVTRRGKTAIHLLTAYDPTKMRKLPYYIYLGSADLSPDSWGILECLTEGEEALNEHSRSVGAKMKADPTWYPKNREEIGRAYEESHKRIKHTFSSPTRNFEVGVVIPGDVLPELLEKGSNWEEVVFVRRKVSG